MLRTSFQDLLSQEIPLLVSGTLDHGDEDESETVVVAGVEVLSEN